MKSPLYLAFSWLNSPVLFTFYKVRKLIITYLESQTYVWHGYKGNFGGPQINLQPALIKSQNFRVFFEIFGFELKVLQMKP